jgi:hypothetical protein
LSDSIAGEDALAAAMGEMPAVSAILLTYNCEGFVAAALGSALAQDYAGPMEIVVSDDASQDHSFKVAESLVLAYRGPHRLALRRRLVNSGSKSAHLNDALTASSGQLLVSFDGDDISRPERVSRIVERFRANPRAQAVYSSFALIAGSRWQPSHVPRPPTTAGSQRWFARVDAYAAGATLAVRRTVIEAFGPLDPALNEDVQLPFRASLLGDVEHIDAPLVGVHRHAGSFTADWQRYSSLETYRERMLVGIETAARVRQRRHEDLERAVQLRPQEREHIEPLHDAIEQSFREAEMTRPLVADRAAERIRGLFSLWRAGAYPDELAQHAFLALAPRTYLRFRRRRLGLARRCGDIAGTTAR